MSESGLHLSNDAYFSPGPVLALDRKGRRVDANVAADVMWGSGAGSAAVLPAGVVALLVDDAARFNAGEPLRSIAGRLARVTHRPPGFGSAEVEWTRIPVFAADGDLSGWHVFGSLLAVEREAELQAALQKRWRHELAWHLYAMSYDRVLLEMPYYHEVLERHRVAMTGNGIRDVLDVGAGTGNVTVPVAATGRRVTAVDTSRAMLARLRAKLASEAGPVAMLEGTQSSERGSVMLREEKLRSKPNSVAILEQSATELDALPDESFDGITILLSLYDMDQPVRALEHAIRLLRAGGILVVTEPKRAFALAPILAEVERVLRSKSLWRALERDWQRVRDVNVELDPSIDARAQRAGRLFLEDIVAILEERGFSIASTRDSHIGNCATIVATKASVGPHGIFEPAAGQASRGDVRP